MSQHNVAAYDLKRMVGFANSVAYAKAAAIGTSVKLEKFSDNTIMNALIMACTGEGGFAMPEQDVRQIESYRDRFARKFIADILDCSAKSPGDVAGHFKSLEQEKARALAEVQRYFDAARTINSTIDDRLRLSINTLSSVKAASCLFLAWAPLGAAAVGGVALAATAGGISLVFSLTKSAAKNLAEGNSVGVIAWDEGKDLAKEGASRGTAQAAAHMTVQEQLFQEALGKVRNLSATLEKATRSKYRKSLERQIGKQQAKMAGTGMRAAAAPAARIAAKGLPVVFAAMDTWDAITDFGNEWQSH